MSDALKSWSVTQEKVDMVVDRIVQLAQPRQVIAFGSYATGRLHPNSDLDLLIVLPDPVERPTQEAARLYRELGPRHISVDLVVVSEERLAELAEARGLVYREALRTGKVLYDAAPESVDRQAG